MGKAIAYGLAWNSAGNIVIADRDIERARYLVAFVGSRHERAPSVRKLDLSDKKAIASFLRNVDVAVSAASYTVNLTFTTIAIVTGNHLCDLGGNYGVMDSQLALRSPAEKIGMTVVPHCGLRAGPYKHPRRSRFRRTP